MRSVAVVAPAKVNLFLSVGGLRPDGFHDLVTVFQTLSLTDEVVLSEAARGGIEIVGEGHDVLETGRDNLAVRAVEALADHIGMPAEAVDRVHITLCKRIPVAGGMAGGSADAAATLLGLCSLWNLRLRRYELAEVAARLGSDVPFQLYGGCALGTGRGEVITEVPVAHAFHWVVGVDQGGLSTPEVFHEFDRLRALRPRRRVSTPEAVLDALEDGDPVRLAPALVNDLQEAALALRPDLRHTLDAGVDAGALAGIVSGSGPSCAFLCVDEEHAAGVAERLAATGRCRVVHALRGPAGGPRVLYRATAAD
ncbi:4-(cytidine 5'-diphospho)-2-C-methyl-D-erythritol kinase [Kutzneria sp. NPDC052558]|uniref:4-(cytidine 5'-diphospho)-2-C-methyl-D-erythritol kinase n=1 Tax=Kutzneria sp. NPDC052558 TaxID=3364121 RepID=UPI0037CA5A14